MGEEPGQINLIETAGFSCPENGFGAELPLWVVYYSHNKGPARLLEYCLSDLHEKVAAANGHLVTVTHQPVTRGTFRLMFTGGYSGHLAIYRQILQGLSVIPDKAAVCLVEHDVLYPPNYFPELAAALSVSPARLVYNINNCGLNADGYFERPYGHLMSNLAGAKSILKSAIEQKIEETLARPNRRPKWAEPGLGDDGHTLPNVKLVKCSQPVIDIRHGANFTGMREAHHYFQNLDPWGHADQFTALL